ncbi:winged helix-turn-helix domain-containing protein [Spongiactinospora sp. TRM90649]|uniref:winged helix-turn-helix domain-containing protein n=1 Tax=Spongiactinospora sp. TRM90649 TaxID=3031114 RepID=UPI0023F70501|nr:winged helix-turn-helix domain-containing protein [Spongiactinospora sp. TRM90649]MDF5756444.1 winged helix-turn-helix domain-containing protein [Spongiactinospora sp. TRM90649]
MKETFRVTDPGVLKGVAHPLRLRLLGLLRSDGPATASELARKVGESSGLTSYHLRELARYGFIEEDPERRDARERRWRSVHRYTSWDNAEMAATPEGREAVAALRERQVEMLIRAAAEFDEAAGSWDVEWVEAAGISDDITRLTPASVGELWERFEAILHELAARDAADPAAEQVVVHYSAFPRRPS